MKQATKKKREELDELPEEVDFSKGVRGLHHIPHKTALSIHLDSDVAAYLERVAKNKQADPEKIINEMLRTYFRELLNPKAGLEAPRKKRAVHVGFRNFAAKSGKKE